MLCTPWRGGRGGQPLERGRPIYCVQGVFYHRGRHIKGVQMTGAARAAGGHGGFIGGFWRKTQVAPDNEQSGHYVREVVVVSSRAKERKLFEISCPVVLAPMPNLLSTRN